MPIGYSFNTDSYDSLQVIFVNDGELCMETGEHLYYLKPGMLAFLPPGSVFRLFCNKMGYSGIFAISGDIAHVRYPHAFAFKADRLILALSDAMEKEARLPGPEAESIMKHLGELLLSLAKRKADELSGTVHPEDDIALLVEQIQAIIKHSLYSGDSLQSHLSSIPLSYRQISRIFKRATGETPKQYHLHCRLQEAERLLRDTELPITVIAMDLGFNSSQYFSNQFGRLKGRTPREFRHAH